jgi:hypothetical protein
MGVVDEVVVGEQAARGGRGLSDGSGYGVRVGCLCLGASLVGSQGRGAWVTGARQWTRSTMPSICQSRNAARCGRGCEGPE